jgi:hypothetical protein
MREPKLRFGTVRGMPFAEVLRPIGSIIAPRVRLDIIREIATA